MYEPKHERKCYDNDSIEALLKIKINTSIDYVIDHWNSDFKLASYNKYY